MHMYRHLYLLLLVVSAAVLAVCGKDGPINVDRPPVVRGFIPEEQAFEAFVGDTLTFRIIAVDPDRTSLKQRFSLDDSVVSLSAVWDYVVEDTGLVHVRCTVTDGNNDSWIQWDVSRLRRIDYPPQITGFSPVEDSPVMIVGNDLEFAVQASDPEQKPLEYFFTVDGSLAATEAEFVYTATSIGEREIEAVVTDGENFATHVWHLAVTPVPDSIPPAEVQILTVETGVQPGEINISWTAVGADSMEGTASNYLVRTSPSPIIDEISWSRGSERPGVPAPLPPGEVMSMVLDRLTPARFTFIAVRAIDDFGNISPLGVAPGGYTRGMRMSGKVLDAYTGLPMPNAFVSLAHFNTATDAAGEFGFIELPPIDSPLIVSDDGQTGVVGAYYDLMMPYVVVHEDYVVVYLIPDYQLDTVIYPDFLAFFFGMTKLEGFGDPRYSPHQRRWEPPIDVYTEPLIHLGLDYQATIHRVVEDLNPYLGMDLFNVLTDHPAIGVTCVYRSGITADNYGVKVWTPDWYPLEAEIEFRTVYSPSSLVPFERVIRHEFGHALGLNHSEDVIHLMIGGITPQVDNFSDDEIALIRVRYHLPRGLSITYYVRE